MDTNIKNVTACHCSSFFICSFLQILTLLTKTPAYTVPQELLLFFKIKGLLFLMFQAFPWWRWRKELGTNKQTSCSSSSFPPKHNHSTWSAGIRLCRCYAAVLSTKKEEEGKGKGVWFSTTTFMPSHFKTPPSEISQQDSRRVSYHVLPVIFCFLLHNCIDKTLFLHSISRFSGSWSCQQLMLFKHLN